MIITKLREYTGFSPLAYSLDLILPLVDLQQEHDHDRTPMIPAPKNTRAAGLFALGPKHLTRLVLWGEIVFGWMASWLLSFQG